MIEAAASFLLSNAITLYNVGCEIHIKTPIALFHLPPPLNNYQSYLIVLKSTEASVPSKLTVPSNQVFFCGKMAICPKSDQPTITVEEHSWIVHQGQLPNLHEYEKAHVWGRARVLNVHWQPFQECVSMIDVFGFNKSQVRSFFKRLEERGLHQSSKSSAHFYMILAYLKLRWFWGSLNPASSMSWHHTRESLTYSNKFNRVIQSAS